MFGALHAGGAVFSGCLRLKTFVPCKQRLWRKSLTREEYHFLRRRYEQLDPASPHHDEKCMSQFEDAVLRVFVQHRGHELFWEEETEARVARQKTFSALAQYGK